MLVALIVSLIFHTAQAPLAAVNPCTAFDQWTGLPEFPYTVDANGEWNFPDDAELMTTVTFPVGGMWIFYAKSTETRYTIIFRDFEPDAGLYGTHHICVFEG